MINMKLYLQSEKNDKCNSHVVFPSGLVPSKNLSWGVHSADNSYNTFRNRYTIWAESNALPSSSRPMTGPGRGTRACPFLPKSGLLYGSCALELPIGLAEVSQNCSIIWSTFYPLLFPPVLPSQSQSNSIFWSVSLRAPAYSALVLPQPISPINFWNF